MLSDYEKTYDFIMDSCIKVSEKNYKLARLMTKMEEAYDIPVVNNEDWNTTNKEVIELYRIISNSRVFTK